MMERKSEPVSKDLSEKKRSFTLGWTFLSAIFIFFLFVPLFIDDPYFLHIFILTFLFAYLGTAWSLVSMAGQLSMGHAAFLGIGGYISTLMFMEWGVTPWLGMFAGGICCAIVGVLVGYPTFRLKGPYFALTTIALAEILRIYTENTEVGPFGIPLRAAMGLLVPLKGHVPSVYQFDGKEHYYYISFILMCLSIVISFVINRTRIGYYLAAIRSDQDAAESLAIGPAPRK